MFKDYEIFYFGVVWEFFNYKNLFAVFLIEHTILEANSEAKLRFVNNLSYRGCYFKVLPCDRYFRIIIRNSLLR